MEGFRYLDQAPTLKFNADVCIACGMCREVCPHQVFEFVENNVRLKDVGACMECGACMRNCPVSAICVTVGVGCATGLIHGWLRATIGINSSGNGCC